LRNARRDRHDVGAAIEVAGVIGVTSTSPRDLFKRAPGSTDSTITHPAPARGVLIPVAALVHGARQRSSPAVVWSFIYLWWCSAWARRCCVCFSPGAASRISAFYFLTQFSAWPLAPSSWAKPSAPSMP